MKRSQMIEALKKAYEEGLFCEPPLPEELDETLNEEAEQILLQLITHGIFAAEDMEED